MESTTTGSETASKCAPGAGDLTLVWDKTDATATRGEAVVTGAGRVVWVASDLTQTSHLRVLDLDGEPMWAKDMMLTVGPGTFAYKDVAIDGEGKVVLAGTTNSGAVVHWFDASGNPLGEHVRLDAEWYGVALLADGSVAVAGKVKVEVGGDTDGDTDTGGQPEGMTDGILVQRYMNAGVPAWSQTFAEMGANWGSDIHVTVGQGLLVSGHSNEKPGPVLLAYDANGVLQWSHIDPGEWLDEEAMSVAADSTGRALVTVSNETSGRIDRFDAGGAVESSIALDFQPRSIAIDVDDNFVVAGRDWRKKIVVVERRDAAGDLLARHERSGDWALGVAVDGDCHAYVVGAGFGDGWLEKLN